MFKQNETGFQISKFVDFKVNFYLKLLLQLFWVGWKKLLITTITIITPIYSEPAYISLIMPYIFVLEPCWRRQSYGQGFCSGRSHLLRTHQNHQSMLQTMKETKVMEKKFNCHLDRHQESQNLILFLDATSAFWRTSQEIDTSHCLGNV